MIERPVVATRCGLVGPVLNFIGVIGFEPTTSCSQSRRAAKLRHTPLVFFKGQHIANPGSCQGDNGCQARSGQATKRPPPDPYGTQCPLRNRKNTFNLDRMDKINLLGYTRSQMEDLMKSLGEKPFKGRQLFKWLYFFGQYDFQLMTDLTKDLRNKLDEQYRFELLHLKTRQVSSDGTEKYLFELDDGHPIESVLIPDLIRGNRTLCISSQSGCALKCGFCATGSLGLLRNLTAGEILGQMITVRSLFDGDCFSNVVLMGMGEPLNNYDNLVEALAIMNDPAGLTIGSRKTTVSTSGISPRIIKLADSGLKVRLAVSLHAATQEKRLKIMPLAKTYPLDGLMEAIRYYTKQTGTRVTFEYILFDDFNDSMEDIKAISRLIKGIPCKINVLAYNPVDGFDYKRPSDEKVNWFGKQLYPRAPAVMIRKSRGRDIDAACGQLAGKTMSDSKNEKQKIL